MLRLGIPLIAVALAALATGATAPSIQLDTGGFKVAGWSAPNAAPAKGWPSVFAVFAGNGDVPPLAGSYAVQSGTLVFRPAFPISPGMRYRAIFRPPDGGSPIEKTFDGPARDTTRRTRVEHIYPSAAIWPANQLRFYIYFSAPMSRGEAGRRVRLMDAGGNEVRSVFLPGEELWDPNCQRLTMTFDPGRIKRGLTSNETMGPPITEGGQYRLVIDGGWPDARGVPMIEGFTKTFRGGPAERTPPDPRQWRVTAPKPGTTSPLTVDFPKPMSYPLLQRMLQVAIGSRPVPGAVEVEPGETRWRFTPQVSWKTGDYRLVVNSAIEDLAGNHIGQAFDIDVFNRVTEHIASSTISLPFAIR